MSILKKATDQIALAACAVSGSTAWVKKTEEMPYGKEERRYIIDLLSGEKEKLSLKPTPCISGTEAVGADGKWFYYQERYPKRAICCYDPALRETKEICTVKETIGAFAVDGDVLAYTTETEVGTEPRDTYTFYHLLNGSAEVLQAPQARLKRHTAEFHKAWYFAANTLYFIPDDDSFTDETGKSLKGALAGYGLTEQKVRRLSEIPEHTKVLQMLRQDEKLWLLTKEMNGFALLALDLKEPEGTLEEITFIQADSYDQVDRVQMNEKGLFWSCKEMHSLIENATTLWYYSWEKTEKECLIKLSEFRPLNIRFNQVGDYIYYQDEFWKKPCCTNILQPNGKEELEEAE